MENANNVLYFKITLEDKNLFDSKLLASIVYKIGISKVVGSLRNFIITQHCNR
jgi:hypothetical protein